jgi:hypothetical protein
MIVAATVTVTPASRFRVVVPIAHSSVPSALACPPLVSGVPSPLRRMDSDRLRLAQGFPWTVFGLTVTSVLQGEALAEQLRDCDCVEIFSGCGSVWRAAQQAGKKAQGYDKHRVPGVTDQHAGSMNENILTRAGFLHALTLVLRLCPRGLLWLAPMCNSFSWLALSVTMRAAHNSYVGDESRACVREGNLAARAAAFLMIVAWVRMVHVVVENPSTSMLFRFYEAAHVILFDPKVAICARCAFSDEPEGYRLLKRYKLLSNEPWIVHLHRSCTCTPPKRHAPLISVKTIKGHSTRTGITSALRESAVYPDSFGTAVVQAWLGQTPGVHACPPSAQACAGLAATLEDAAASTKKHARLARSSTTQCQPALTEEPDILAVSDDDSADCLQEQSERASHICGSSSSSASISSPALAFDADD